MSVVSATARAAGVAPQARRVLAVLECRPSDDAVLTRAVEIAVGSGGYLTPPGVPVIAALDRGRTKDVIRRRVQVAAHDLVVVRTRGRRFAQLPVSMLAC
jgi:hypothetical protein